MSELSPLQKQTLEAFSQSPLKDLFYWTGGTLLAVIYLHHRKSQDLDFFSDKPFSHDQLIGFIGDLKKRLGLEYIEEKKIHDRREFFLHNGEQVRLEFVHYNHPALKPREEWNGVNIDSLDDIATNKLMAMLDRNEPKDVFDLYFLLTKGGYSLSTLTDLMEKKFGVRIQEGLLWSEAFRGIKEIDNLRPLLLQQDKDKQDKLLQEMKDYFTKHSQQFLDRQLE